ncbi:MAG: helix-turn-helix transcriptional regulator [Candidatus Limiplasma sp.]|nr:helix-turn-helix transcriptional regulator [Candidatus Limiplasma sp.]
MNYAAIGDRIRRRRRALGYTQEDLAELIHVSHSFIGHIERGSRTGSLKTYVEICRVIGLTLDDIVGLPHIPPDELECSQKDLGKVRAILQYALDMTRP